MRFENNNKTLWEELKILTLLTESRECSSCSTTLSTILSVDDSYSRISVKDGQNEAARSRIP